MRAPAGGRHRPRAAAAAALPPPWHPSPSPRPPPPGRRHCLGLRPPIDGRITVGANAGHGADSRWVLMAVRPPLPPSHPAPPRPTPAASHARRMHAPLLAQCPAPSCPTAPLGRQCLQAGGRAGGGGVVGERGGGVPPCTGQIGLASSGPGRACVAPCAADAQAAAAAARLPTYEPLPQPQPEGVMGCKPATMPSAATRERFLAAGCCTAGHHLTPPTPPPTPWAKPNPEPTTTTFTPAPPLAVEPPILLHAAHPHPRPWLTYGPAVAAGAGAAVA